MIFEFRDSVSVIIPAFNEEKTIGDIIRQANDFGEVLVIDDASTDQTANIARQAGARVISHLENIGQSGADRTGYLASDRPIIALIDADNQQLPEELLNVIEPVFLGKADMVIGSKYFGTKSYSSRPANYMTERLVQAVLWSKFRISISNSFSGLRAMRRDCIDFSYLKGNRHECAVELAFSFARNGHRIIEVPRTARKRTYGKSSIRITDGLRIWVRLGELVISS